MQIKLGFNLDMKLIFSLIHRSLAYYLYIKLVLIYDKGELLHLQSLLYGESFLLIVRIWELSLIQNTKEKSILSIHLSIFQWAFSSVLLKAGINLGLASAQHKLTLLGKNIWISGCIDRKIEFLRCVLQGILPY